VCLQQIGQRFFESFDVDAQLLMVDRKALYRRHNINLVDIGVFGKRVANKIAPHNGFRFSARQLMRCVGFEFE
jgi:hypothetical protein